MYIFDQVARVIGALDKQGGDICLETIDAQLDEAIAQVTSDEERAYALRRMMEELLKI